ncbi:MAG: substrate-binding domain-containing protein, partial [Roseibium sp.]
PERELRDIALMLDHRVAGLIVAPTSLGDGYAENLAKAVTCPAVLVDRVVAPEKFDIVADDNELGGTLVADYLLRLGHRDIAFLVGRPGISASFERFEAVKAALEKAGAGLSENLVRHAIFTVEGAYTAVQELMAQPHRPTALICISNPQIQGAMAGLTNMGLRVPDDVSVIGFDGFNPPEGWSPVITCLVQDTQTLSELSVDKLLGRIAKDDADSPGITRVRPRLRVGTSCRSISGPDRQAS